MSVFVRDAAKDYNISDKERNEADSQLRCNNARSLEDDDQNGRW